MIRLHQWDARSEPGALLVLAGLATWRVSHLLVAEDGPGEVIVKMRAAVDGTPLAGVMDCFGCTSLWVGPAAAAVVLRGRATTMDTLLIGAGLSGAAYLVEMLRTTRAASAAGPAEWVEEPVEDSDLIRVTGP